VVVPGAGVTVTFSVTGGNAVSGTLFTVGSMLYATNGPLPSSFSFTVATDTVGVVNIQALTYGAGPTNYSASTYVIVQPSGQLNSITVTPQSLNFSFPSQMAGLIVLGNYSDGIQRDITSTNAGTFYTTASGSNLVVSLGTNGAVTAMGNGQDSIIISNGLVSTSVVVNVQISNYPPILNAISNQSLAAGSTLTVPIQAVDPMGNAIKFSTNSLPDFVTLTDNGNGTGFLSLAPGTNDVGASSVTIVATDNGTPSLGAFTTFTVTVAEASVSDGVANTWRAQYFGGNGTTTNDQSCATCDADGTGQNNLFKYVAGLDPTNPASVFVVKAANMPTLPNQFNVLFNPVVAGRIYTPQYSTDLVSGVWLPLMGYAGPATNGTQVTITDLNATTPRKFYRFDVALLAEIPPFEITAITLSGHDVNLVWNGEPGSNVVQVSTGTSKGGYTNNFIDLAAIIVPSFGVTNYVDSGGATNTPARYYRVRLVP
jgi:hypothetical protein